MKVEQFVNEAWDRGVRITERMVYNFFLFSDNHEYRSLFFDNDLDVPEVISAEQILQKIQAENAARTKPGVPRKEVTHC
jgi:hypothetical protein